MYVVYCICFVIQFICLYIIQRQYKWVEIIESCGDLNVTKRELEIAPEGSLFPIKFCAGTSNISDDSKWVFGILQKTSNNTVFELRNLI